MSRKRSRPGVMVAFRCPAPLFKRLRKYVRHVKLERTRAIIQALDVAIKSYWSGHDEMLRLRARDKELRP